MVGQKLLQADVGKRVLQQAQDGAEWAGSHMGSCFRRLDNM
jgi:hypothetical protein